MNNIFFRLRNDGKFAWPIGTVLICEDPSIGNLFSAPNTIQIDGPVYPGAYIDISVDLQAPTTSQMFTCPFRLQTPEGILFGPRIWVKIYAIPPNPNNMSFNL